jgi:hypothetical protein
VLAFLAILQGCEDSDSTDPATTMSLPDAVGDWVRQEPPTTYDRESIFDYINGAGEVYRSYAFREVMVGRYVRAGSPALTVELFDMGTAEDAYGVFSYAREQEEEGIGAAYELKGSILCFWQDRFYVCVALEPGSAEPTPILEEVALGISRLLPAPGRPPPLLDAVPSEGMAPFSTRFFHTHQSLNYHYYLVRENVLSLTPETDVVLARYRPGPTYLLVVDYGSEDVATEALARFRAEYLDGAVDAETVSTADGRIVSTAREGRHVVVVLDALSETAADDLRSATLEDLRQLAR